MQVCGLVHSFLQQHADVCYSQQLAKIIASPRASPTLKATLIEAICDDLRQHIRKLSALAQDLAAKKQQLIQIRNAELELSVEQQQEEESEQGLWKGIQRLEDKLLQTQEQKIEYNLQLEEFEDENTQQQRILESKKFINDNLKKSILEARMKLECNKTISTQASFTAKNEASLPSTALEKSIDTPGEVVKSILQSSFLGKLWW